MSTPGKGQPGLPPQRADARPGDSSLVSDLGERGLIDRISRRLPAATDSLIVGIGDDAAVVKADRGALQVLTTDALVEGVHFDRRFSTLTDVGYKALAVNVSDVAAMGGTPRFALLSLMLPPETATQEVDALLEGALEIATAAQVTLAGGNVTRSPGPLVIDVALIGSVKPRKILTRAGGHPGDALFVTGTVGAAAAGLGWLREHAGNPTVAPADPELAECVRRYRRPEPRARVGSLLGRGRAASACIDLSDGLAAGVRQIAQASGAGATIDAAKVPIHPAARRWFASRDQDALLASLDGGDDYELLFAVPSRTRSRFRTVERQARHVPLACIGRLTSDPAVIVVRDGRAEALPGGFAHF